MGHTFYCSYYVHFRNRKRQKSKSLVRDSVNKRTSSIKNRPANTVRTRRLRSSTSSDLSTSAIPSPITNDENNDDDFLSKKKSDNDRVEVYKLRSNRTEKMETSQKNATDSSKESDQDDDDKSEKEETEKSTIIEAPKLDESIREFLWQPTKSSTSTTTITEVTDQSGVTVLIRELNDVPTQSISRQPRFLGYGNGGRGGRH